MMAHPPSQCWLSRLETLFACLSPELSVKRLELLKEAVPSLARMAVLWRPENRVNHLRLMPQWLG